MSRALYKPCLFFHIKHDIINYKVNKKKGDGRVMKRTREGKRSIIKSLIFGFIFLMLLIALIGSCTADPEPEPVAEAPKVVQPKDTEKNKLAESQEKAKQEKELEDAKQAQTDLENKSLELLQQNFEGVGTVEFNKEQKAFLITSTDPAFIEEVQMVADGRISQEVWYDLQDSMVYLSESISGLLGQGYTVAMVNPLNTDRLLLIIEDGVVTYDVMQDSQASPI